MKAVFINLDRAEQRRRFMERQAAHLGLVLEHFPAVEAGDITPNLLTTRGRAWERPLTTAELGCFLSHEALWKRVAASPDPLLILEDDVVLTGALPSLLVELENLGGIDFLNLESCDRRRFVAADAVTFESGARLLRVYRDKSGSAGYVLWPSGARKLLAKSEKGAAPVDAFLHGLRALASFQIEPAVAMQLHILEARGVPVPISSATFIQTPRDRLPLDAASLPFRLRRLATQVRLGVDHGFRIFGRRYRRTDVVERDFAEAASAAADPDAGEGLASVAIPLSSQRRS